jgi:tetratricopeptide (TPR) repeat protein
MKSRVFILAALLILVTVCATDALAQGGHTIRGKVRNSAGLNLARIMVTLESGTGGVINQTVTNNEGDFTFVGLNDTSYLVTISGPDYNPTSERVEFVRNVSENDPGETRTIDITLAAKEGAAIRRAGVRFIQDVPKEALNAFEQAKKFMGGGRTQEAQAALENAIRLFPDYFEARFMLANEYVSRSLFDEAIKQLNEARRINPKDDRVWFAFGTILMRQGKHAVAARVFSEAANLNPSDPEYPFMQGVALINQGALTQATSPQASAERNYFFAEAEKALLRAYDVSRKTLNAIHLQLARLHEKRGDRNRAANELEEYLRKSPNSKNSAAIREAIKKLRQNG